MTELQVLEKKGTLTSLEILDQINFFRKEEGNKTELGHNDLLKIIREEFSEEISLGKISQSTYKTSRGKEYPMFILTLSQAKQILVRESKFVRKAVINYVEKLENQLKNQLQVPQTVEEIIIFNMQEQKKIKGRLEVVENKVDNEIRVDHGEQRKIQRSVGTRVYQRVEIIKADKNKLFQALYRDLKDRFGVASYRDIKRKDLTIVLDYISTWIEKAELREVS